MARFGVLLLLCGLTPADPQPPAPAEKNNTDRGVVDPARPLTAGDLRAVTDKLDRLAQDVRKVDDQTTKLADLATERLAELGRRIDAFQRELTELRNRVDLLDRAGTQSQSQKDPRAAGASVQLVNAHPVMDMTAVVNGGVHTVAPGRSLGLPVVVGPVSVQVMQTDATPRAQTLTAGQTFVVTMR